MESEIHPQELHKPDQVAALTLRVPDLAESLLFFTTRLGFRLEMIVPADSPRIALISGQGVTLRLDASLPETPQAPQSPLENHHRDFVVSRPNEANVWIDGRAGMQYRDLIPDRLGGRFIASHIRIPEGGETPDYVHYHKVRFQIIFCKAGWARLLYEDQGPPFLFHAGDCILQPPQIRHRVLETSAGFEVIEVGYPAIHETWVDHDLKLPNDLNPGRVYSGQTFVHYRANTANHLSDHSQGFEVHDTGIAAATTGFASVVILRSPTQLTSIEKSHSGQLLFLFVLQGSVNLAGEVGAGEWQLEEGDSIAIPPNVRYRLRGDAGLEMLEVRVPAESG